MRYDPTEWQYSENGNVLLVSDMTKADLEQALCRLMDQVSQIDFLHHRAADVLKAAWSGTDLPEDE